MQALRPCKHKSVGAPITYQAKTNRLECIILWHQEEPLALMNFLKGSSLCADESMTTSAPRSVRAAALAVPLATATTLAPSTLEIYSVGNTFRSLSSLSGYCLVQMRVVAGILEVILSHWCILLRSGSCDGLKDLRTLCTISTSSSFSSPSH